MKRLLIAFALACVLTGTALAGEMPGVENRQWENAHWLAHCATDRTGRDARRRFCNFKRN